MGKECPSRTGLARVGEDVQLAGWRVSGRRAPSGWEWKGSQSCQGTTELVFPGPVLWQMQSEAARRAGEPSGHREEPPPEGLGGHHLLTQTDARRPASQQLCWLSRRIGNFCRTRTTPWRIIFDHGVQDGEQFTHASDQGHFLRLTDRQQPLVEVADDGIVTGRGQGPHVENTPNPGASAPDGASASQGAAVPVEGRHAHQGRDLPSVQSAQLGEVGQQGESC